MYLYTYWSILYVCGGEAHAMTYMWRPGYNLWETNGSIDHLCFGNRTEAIMLVNVLSAQPSYQPHAYDLSFA